jgi:hypothetical protein
MNLMVKKSLGVLFIGLCLAGTAYAETHDHHSHDSHEAAAPEATLKLNNGAKWATDQPLRDGMAAIRKLASPAPKGAPSAADSAALAKKVEAQVSNIIGSCHLEPQADAMLHIVLARILDGTKELGGATAAERKAGLDKINKAVADFYVYFNAKP